MFKKATLGLLVVLFSSSLGMAQVFTPGGYVVVTPQGSTITAFAGAATLFNSTNIGVAGVEVGPAPLLTSAALLVNTTAFGESATIVDTGTRLSFVSPSASAAAVNLVLTDSFGEQISNRTILVPGRSQVLVFVNGLLGPDVTVGSSGLLLRMTSNIPVAIQALDFRGLGFTSVPITNPAAPTTTPTIVGTFTRTPTVTTTFGIGVATVPTGAICVPSTFPPSTISVGAPATTGQITNGTTSGGAGAFIFPEVARGDGGPTLITVGNLSKTTTQFVRFDFFTPDGAVIRSISNVAISPEGFVAFSSDFDGIILPQT